MIDTARDWRYSDTFDELRAQRLLRVSDFKEIVEFLSDAQVQSFAWEPFDGVSLSGCNRASFLLKVLPETYDAFFNSPVGYRSQYAQSVSDGEAANGLVLSCLEGKLLRFLGQIHFEDFSTVIASVRAMEAKIWIYEPEVASQLSYGQPSIVYGPWLRRAEIGLGLLAPLGTLLEVKGGWLDEQGQERLNPAKAGRSKEIHESGFS